MANDEGPKAPARVSRDAKLIRFDEAESIARGDGIATVRLTPALLPGQEFQMGITSFPPGTSIPLHSHNTIEQVTVLEGEGEAELNGERIPVRPYDTTQMPAGEIHRFLNTGSSVMRILWVYGAAHVTRTFTETGETVDQFASRGSAEAPERVSRDRDPRSSPPRGRI